METEVLKKWSRFDLKDYETLVIVVATSSLSCWNILEIAFAAVSANVRAELALNRDNSEKVGKVKKRGNRLDTLE
jgi:hypothetical protein